MVLSISDFASKEKMISIPDSSEYSKNCPGDVVKYLKNGVWHKVITIIQYDLKKLEMHGIPSDIEMLFVSYHEYDKEFKENITSIIHKGFNRYIIIFITSSNIWLGCSNVISQIAGNPKITCFRARTIGRGIRYFSLYDSSSPSSVLSLKPINNNYNVYLNKLIKSYKDYSDYSLYILSKCNCFRVEYIEGKKRDFMRKGIYNFPKLKFLRLDCDIPTSKFYKLNMENIITLDISHAKIHDISCLCETTSFSGLKHLNMSSTHITDIEPLKHIKNIITLDISHTNIFDISCLCETTSFSGLKHLNMSSTHITDIEPLKHIKNIITLDISHTYIKDISCLYRFSNLNKLYMAKTRVADISYLDDLSNLEILDVSYNHITNTHSGDYCMDVLDNFYGRISQLIIVGTVFEFLNKYPIQSRRRVLEIYFTYPKKIIGKLNNTGKVNSRISDYESVWGINKEIKWV